MSNLDSLRQRAAVVIYHADCNDGFTAAWVFHKWYESQYKHVDYISASYGEDIPDSELTKNRDVYILDFSYKPDLLIKLADNSNSVTLLDHHKTAKEDWEKALVNWYEESDGQATIPSNLDIHFDMSKSGAGLAWERFRITDEYQRTPVMVLHAQDYDLWKFEHPNTKAYIARIALEAREFEVWDKLYDWLEHDGPQSYTSFIAEGTILELAFEKQCWDIILAGAKEITIGKFTGLGVNAPAMFASRIGNILANRSGTFGATWFEDSKGVTRFSLRSNGAFDVSAIAKEYGGGGHKNASGFSFVPASQSKDGRVVLWKMGE